MSGKHAKPRDEETDVLDFNDAVENAVSAVAFHQENSRTILTVEDIVIVALGSLP